MDLKIVERKNGTKKVLSMPSGKSLTKQSFKKECDIHSILEKHKRTGVMTVRSGSPQYGDFFEPLDYQDALNTIIVANEQFASLPAAIRDKFANDPLTFLEFCTNEENSEEMIKMGLKEAPKTSPNDKIVPKETLPIGSNPTSSNAAASGANEPSGE